MICIAYVSPGTVSTLFHESVCNLLKTDENVTAQISMISGPRISTARNTICFEFLDHPSKPEWLFMVDSDMIFEADICKRFLDVSNPKIRPVIGGLCFGGGRMSKPFPTMYTLCDPKSNNGKFTKLVIDYPKDALCKVDATGAAGLFIHRDALLQVQEKFRKTPDGYMNPHPWFCESILKGHEFGEDWAFCMRLQACGIPLYVHTGIKLGHQKVCNYDEAYYQEYRRTHPDYEKNL